NPEILHSNVLGSVLRIRSQLSNQAFTLIPDYRPRQVGSTVILNACRGQSKVDGRPTKFAALRRGCLTQINSSGVVGVPSTRTIKCEITYCPPALDMNDYELAAVTLHEMGHVVEDGVVLWPVDTPHFQ